MELAVAEMVEMRRRMVDILTEATGQSRERIIADIDRDYIVRGDQAVAYGLVDHVIERRDLLGKLSALLLVTETIDGTVVVVLRIVENFGSDLPDSETTFYLLPGIDGGDNLDPGADFAPGTKSWFGFTDLQGFFGNKNVNVVSPLGGAFSSGPRGRGVRHAHQGRRDADQRHRDKIGENVVGEVRVEKAVDRVRERPEEDGVAVGRRAHRSLGADIGAGAGLVLHHDLLAPEL